MNEAQKRKETLVGKRFGRLLVLSKCDKSYVSPRGKKHNRWNCICDCGKRSTPDTGSLNSGKSKSCGCFITPEGLLARARGRKEDASASDVYSSYKRNALKRGYDFKISKDEAIKFFKQNCFYCGRKPSSIAKKCALPFLYNGIDRRNNLIGYTLENCVPCCGVCNRAKMDLNYEDFIIMIKNIYNNLIKNNDNRS